MMILTPDANLIKKVLVKFTQYLQQARAFHITRKNINSNETAKLKKTARNENFMRSNKFTQNV